MADDRHTPRITRLRRHPRRERVRLYLDDAETPTAELALDLVLRAGLVVGDRLPAAELEALVAEDDGFRARDAAISLLSHRARTGVELRRRLARKEFAAATIDATMAWLDERGYLDDAAFAEAWVRDRIGLRPRGRFALLRELGRKGVDAETAGAAVDRVMKAEQVDEAGVARDAAEAWSRRNRPALRRAARSREDRDRARRRLYGHLARRGFSPDAVRGAIDALFSD